MDETKLVFRSPNGDDLPFIHDSWGSSYYRGSAAYRLLTPDEFHSFHRPLRERFFNRKNTKIVICSPEEDPWLILGWIAVESIPSAYLLQYIYVKSAFKGQGIAAKLIKLAIPTQPVVYTHLTERASRIISKKQDFFYGFKHVPQLT